MLRRHALHDGRDCLGAWLVVPPVDCDDVAAVYAFATGFELWV
jgi:hypothetical protein